MSYCVWSTVPFFGVGRHDDGRNTGTRTPTVSLRHFGVVVEAAVFVVSHDDQHVLPLRAGLQLGNQISNVRIAVSDVGVAVVLVQVALRLVERHGGQRAVF